MKQMFYIYLIHWLFYGCGTDASFTASINPFQNPFIESKPNFNQPQIGLYAIDGTNVKKSNNNIIHQFYNSADVTSKKYFEGPNLIGSDVRKKIEAVKKKICDDWVAGDVSEVFLIGYSRGATIAIAAAYELLTDPMETGEWDENRRFCLNSNSSLASEFEGDIYDLKPRIRWLGLLDNVNTLNYDMPAIIHDEVDHCIHRVKQQEWEHVLTTKHVEGCEVSKADHKTEDLRFPLNHVRLGKDRPSFKLFRESSVASGLIFQ